MFSVPRILVVAINEKKNNEILNSNDCLSLLLFFFLLVSEPAGVYYWRPLYKRGKAG